MYLPAIMSTTIPPPKTFSQIYHFFLAKRLRIYHYRIKLGGEKLKGCPDCAKYEKRIKELEEKVAFLIFELEELRSKRYKPKNKPPRDNTPTPSRKKRGGLFGHTGWFRQKPRTIDKIEDVRLDTCPLCGCKDIRECAGIHEHLQQDIILPQIETTLFKKHLYYCKGCKRVVTARGDGELPNSYIGPTARALAVFLKYGVKISDRDIVNIFGKMFNLKIRASSIAGFREQLKHQAKGIYDELLEGLRQSGFIHADETGWGLMGWLWKFSNKKICITHIDKSRGQKVVEAVLGKEYEGVLISDFLSAYNKVATKAKQRCLIHLLRDLKKVIRYWHDDKQVLRYCHRLKKLLEEAIQLHRDYLERAWDEEYRRRRQRITERLLDFQFPNPNKRILQRFVKRLNRHKEELFSFLYYRGVDYHNNHAEQQIRPDVIFRKITFGNKSINGTQTHQVLTSILQTAKLNNLDPINTLTQILSNKNPLSEVIASCKRSPPQIKYAG